MRRPFWVKGTTPWDTFRINLNLVFYNIFYIIGDIAVKTLLVLCFLGIFYVFFYKVPKTIVEVGKEIGTVSDKRKAERSEEQIMSLPIQHKGRKFYKVILEGHEYWYSENFKNNIGFCHSESCHCKTNKVEVVR